LLKGKLQKAESELEVWRKGNSFTTDRGRVPMSPRSPSRDEERFSREVSRKRKLNCLDDMVAQVGDGGKRRRLGNARDPEKEGTMRLPAMIKVGGMQWEDGIGGVERALEEAGIVICEGMRWLVPESELAKRKDGGLLSSTVVVKVRGVDMVGQLCRSGLWVGGYWCSVRRYVAVPLKKKEVGWVRVVGKVMEGVEKMEHRALGKLEKIVGRDRYEEMVGMMKEARTEVRKLANDRSPEVGKGKRVGIDEMGIAKEVSRLVEKEVGQLMEFVGEQLSGIEERLKKGVNFWASEISSVEEEVGMVDERLRVLVTESGGLRAGLAGSRGRGRGR